MRTACDVTIGIPVFRSKPYLREALLSALAQSYPGIEIHVQDDGDDSGAMDIVRELQSTHPRGACIRTATSPRNEGAGAARNRIIDQTSTPFLYFMDSDDTIEPNTIELLMARQRQHAAQMVYASIETIELNGKPPVPHQYHPLTTSHADELPAYAFMHYGTFQSSVCNVLISIDFLRSTGLRFSDAAYWEDLLFTYELLPHVERAVLLPELTYHYRFRPHSLSQFQDRDHIEKDEVLKNVATIERLKAYSRELLAKPYAGYMAYALMMHDLYIVAHIVKKRHQLQPPFSVSEMKAIMHHPFSLTDIVRLSHYRWRNLVLACLHRLPSVLFLLAVNMFLRLKMK